MSKKIYMMVLMGIIAACIIGVGYILYVGRGQREESGMVQQNNDDYYEQQMISYNANLNLNDKDDEVE